MTFKALLTADWHLSRHSTFGRDLVNGIPRFLYTQERTLCGVMAEAKKEDATWHIILGDLVDSRSSYDPLVMHTLGSILQYSSMVFQKTVIVVGNHDRPYKTLNEDTMKISSVSPIGMHASKTTIINKPTVQELGTTASLYFIPWNGDKVALETAIIEARRRAEGKNTFLFGHFAVKNSKTGFGFNLPGVDVELMDGITHTYLGDIHPPQSVSENVTYIGAPYSISNDNIPFGAHRAIVLDFETGEAKSLPTNGPAFYTVDNDARAAIDHAKKGCYVNLLWHDSADQIDMKGLKPNIQYMTKPLPAVVSTDETIQRVSEQAKNASIIQTFDAFASIAGGFFDTATAEQVKGYLREKFGSLVEERLSAISYNRLNYLLLQGFGPFYDKQKLVFKNGITLIEGQRSDFSLASNAAGKTSLLNSVMFALFNSPFRGSVTSVVNATSDVMKMRLNVTGQGDTQVNIRRTRKGDHPTETVININGEDLPIEVDKRLDPVCRVLEISEIAFRHTSTTSVDVPAFLDIAKAETRKRILDSLCGCYILHKMFNEVKAEEKLITTAMADHNVTLAVLQAEMEAAEQRYELAEENFDAMKAAYLEAKEDKSELPTVNSQKSVMEEKYKKTLLRINVVKKALDDMTEDHEETCARLDDLQKSLTELTSKRNGLEAELLKVNKSIEVATKTGTGTCYACGQAIDLDTMVGRKAKLDDVVTRIREKILTVRKEMTEVDAKRGKYNDLCDEMKRLEITADNYQSSVTELDDDTSLITSHEKRVQRAKVRAKEAKDKMVECQHKKLSTAGKFAQYQKTVEEYRHRADIVSAALRCLSPTGLSTFVVSSALPLLQNTVNDYLLLATGGQFSVDLFLELEPAKASKPAVVKLNYHVTNKAGMSKWDCCSTGERTVVKLAFLLGLRHVARPSNLIMLDDLFDPLDDVFREACFAMLKKHLAEYPETSVLVTTHTRNKLWNDVDHIIIVERGNGGIANVTYV